MVQGKALKPRKGEKDKKAKKHRQNTKSHEGLIKGMENRKKK
jgi:hypothetical protein